MRPYTESDVYELEVASADIAARLHYPSGGLMSYRALAEETLEAIIYDAMLALRETMTAEEEV
jgi:hypothetical protein